MKKLTKKIVVNGQEMLMSSIDGQSWFLKVESMYEYEKRSRELPQSEELEIEESEPQPEENLVSVLH